MPSAQTDPAPDDSPGALLERVRTLESAGQWGEAGRVYSALFRRALRDGSPAQAVDALRRGATARGRDGRQEEAEELAELSFEVAERWGLARAAARALNVRGNLRLAVNDLDGAAELYRAALEGARTIRDDELAGLACQNLGVIANIRGELADARSWYLESIAASIRSGDRGAAMLVYNNLGMLCADLREWLEAELYFDRGIEIARRLDDRPMLAMLHANSAEPLIHMGEMARARRALSAAEEVAQSLPDPATLAMAARLRAVISRLEGELDAADAELARAALLALGEGQEMEIEQAEVLGGLARLRWAQGRHEEARNAAMQARERFRALGAAREIRRLDEVLAAWAGAR